MAEDDLLRSYYTRQQDMDNVSRKVQNDNLQRQITAFERLTQHAMSRFHKDKLHQMLQAVSTGIPTIKGAKIVKGDASDIGNITSLSKLKESLNRLENKSTKRKGILKDEEAHVIKYFESFFKDIVFLSELKQYFDERIYKCVYDYFYNPLDDVYATQYATNVNAEVKDISSSDVSRDMCTTEVDEKQNLSRTVSAMYRLNQKWDKILGGEELNEDNFDPDSHYDLVSFSNYSNFEPVFRLIPDVFVKCYNSVELVKQWWTLANKIYPNVITPTQSRDKFEDNLKSLHTSIGDLTNTISRDEQLLKVLKDEYAGLQTREKRFEILELEYNDVDGAYSKLDTKYKAYIKHSKLLYSKMRKLQKGSSEYTATAQDIKGTKTAISDCRAQLTIMDFQRGLVLEDYRLEGEIRPNIIRSVDSVAEMIRVLEKSLTENKDEIRRKEKELALLRTNCDKMKTVMRNVLGSAVDERRGDTNSLISGSADEQSRKTSTYKGEVKKPPKIRADNQNKNHSAINLTTSKVMHKSKDSERSRINNVKIVIEDEQHSGYEARLCESDRELQTRDQFDNEVVHQSTRVKPVSNAKSNIPKLQTKSGQKVGQMEKSGIVKGTNNAEIKESVKHSVKPPTKIPRYSLIAKSVKS